MKEIKKYLIGFIIGLFSIGTLTYAADNGSIGDLFDEIMEGGHSVWRLGGDNIEDDTIDSSEIENGTIEKGDLLLSLSSEITANTLKVGITQDQSDEISVNTDKIVFSGDYSDLNDRPTIPTNNNELDNGRGYITDVGEIKYLKNGSSSSTLKQYGVEVDDTLWVKKNLFVDGKINGLEINNGNINGIPLEEKIKEDATGWENVINKTKTGNGNQSFRLGGRTIPSGNKGVYAIRLRGRVDDGGRCGVYVNGKIAFGVTHRAYFNKLKLNGDWGGRSKEPGSGNFSTTEFYIKNYTGNSSLGAQTYANNSAYNVASGIIFLKPGDYLSSFGNFYGGPGGESLNCMVDVKKGSLYY